MARVARYGPVRKRLERTAENAPEARAPACCSRGRAALARFGKTAASRLDGRAKVGLEFGIHLHREAGEFHAQFSENCKEFCIFK